MARQEAACSEKPIAAQAQSGWPVKASLKKNPKKKTGATVRGSRFLNSISCQLALESELQPELDLPVSINCTNCGSDIHKVRVS
jgi:hypothetical protein